MLFACWHFPKYCLKLTFFLNNNYSVVLETYSIRKWVLNFFLYFGLLGTSLLGSTELRFYKKVILINSTYFHSICCLHCIKFLPFYTRQEPKSHFLRKTVRYLVFCCMHALICIYPVHSFSFVLIKKVSSTTTNNYQKLKECIC